MDRPLGTGFAFRDPARDTVYDWHAHSYHQLLYAIAGTTQIETAHAHYLLPAGRASWIPAGVRHRTTVTDEAHASLYFAPETVTAAGDQVRILVATPMMREMILHAMRWPQGAAEADPLAQSFFATLALLCNEWLESELPLSLPRSDHPGLARAMDYALTDPGGATQAGACHAAAMSERSFRRRFAEETGMGWQPWLAQARILTAMRALAAGARVTDVAADIGYASLSAFAKAFSRLTGESPAEYRRRMTRRGGG
ncbi:AraC family transcriptional regulator [Flavisphingomonas formosensis]|uniref:AraC family transcriptional regulator n=1 Tax=Flavisphingomonas formosensis TaxID=861534 RepID=UPI001E64FEC1|nr:helix-turn-helix transcriptional regulator [Sphingomonas formosensis]